MICKYIRLSSKNKDEKEQSQVIDAYLCKKGLVADNLVRENAVFKGNKYDQALFQKLCRTLNNADWIVVSEVSVIARNSISELCEIIETCIKPNGLRLVVCNVGFDIDFSYNNPMVEMQMNLFASIAQMEKEVIRSRTQTSIDRIKDEIDEFGYHISKSGNKVTKLGNGQAPSEKCLAASAAMKRKRALENENNAKFYKYLVTFEEHNGKFSMNDRETNSKNWEKLAYELNQLGYLTSTGLPFTSMRCRNAYRTLKNLFFENKSESNRETGGDQKIQLRMESTRKKVELNEGNLEAERKRFKNTVQTLDVLLAEDEDDMKDENTFKSSSLPFSNWKKELFELFIQFNYCIDQENLTAFARQNNLMANSMIDRINDEYFELLDDCLIEESENGWMMNQYYYEQIKNKIQ
ncbi:MAG: recombinase family protein [Alphaproteobacteria bacterium]|nr:recombinase family protein [Alphaproteobacteria bacterium]